MLPIVLSFDVEEHDRIEAAVHLNVDAILKRTYADRMEMATRRLLDQLAAADNTPATFYVVGEIAATHPKLVRDIAAAGHEVGSHSHTHLRVHRFSPDTFREDLKRSVDTLEQAAGVKVRGFRAPTFSLMKETAWAVDELLRVGLSYDTSIFPVRHDRYGVPSAPRGPFYLEGTAGRILELPPLTLRRLGQNLPVAGGGYFRLFPLWFMKAGLADMPNGLGMLYFHPWEFDPGQPKLPLGRLSQLRTYVGIGKSEQRLGNLLTAYRGRFRRAADVADELATAALPSFRLR
ncbi:MAG: polysaccharide deacetylase family protein [Fimbriiglobus sp.]|jgi:polysaccharide deacetylase family protein (PEP-CTERM system associated)|nr:polysaccharide deacetylase family protein [Fimbriiglobus sp.]